MLRVWNLSLLCATFCAHHPRHVPHPLGRARLGARLHASRQHRAVASSRSSRSIVLVIDRAHRLARRPAAVARLASTRRISREGAFLANNVLFAAFAFVVLLGTVFPLIVEAVNGERISVGAPYFDRMTMPIGLAPAVPHGGRAGAAVAQGVGRAAAPPAAVAGVDRRGAVVLAVVARRPRLRAARSPSASAASPPARRSASSCWPPAGRAGAGCVGRANGGMIVHLGVVMIAVALAATPSYSHSAPSSRSPRAVGVARRPHDHLPRHSTRRRSRSKSIVKARRAASTAARSTRRRCQQFPGGAQTIGTPSVRTGLRRRRLPHAARRRPTRTTARYDSACSSMPLVVWLWIGGGLMAVGTVLAAWPGRRRRPTDPVSAPVPERRVQTPPPPEETVANRWERASMGDESRDAPIGESPIDDARIEEDVRPRRRVGLVIAIVLGLVMVAAHRDPCDAPVPRSTGRARARSSASPRPTSSARRSRRATARRTSCPTDAAASCSSISSPRGACRASRSTPSSSRSAVATCRPATPRS